MATPNITNSTDWGSPFFGFSPPRPSQNFKVTGSILFESKLDQAIIQTTTNIVLDKASPLNLEEPFSQTIEPAIPYREQLDSARISLITNFNEEMSIDSIVIRAYHKELTSSVDAMDEPLALSADLIQQDNSSDDSDDENSLNPKGYMAITEDPLYAEIFDEKSSSAEKDDVDSYAPSDEEDLEDYMIQDETYKNDKTTSKSRSTIIKNVQGKRIPLEKVLETAEFLISKKLIKAPEAQWQKHKNEAKRKNIRWIGSISIKRIFGHVLICPNQSEQTKTKVKQLSSQLFKSNSYANPSCELCLQKKKEVNPPSSSSSNSSSDSDEMSGVIYSSDISLSNHSSEKEKVLVNDHEDSVKSESSVVELAHFVSKKELSFKVVSRKFISKKEILKSPFKTNDLLTKNNLRKISIKELLDLAASLSGNSLLQRQAQFRIRMEDLKKRNIKTFSWDNLYRRLSHVKTCKALSPEENQKALKIFNTVFPKSQGWSGATTCRACKNA